MRFIKCDLLFLLSISVIVGVLFTLGFGTDQSTSIEKVQEKAQAMQMQSISSAKNYQMDRYRD